MKQSRFVYALVALSVAWLGPSPLKTFADPINKDVEPSLTERTTQTADQSAVSAEIRDGRSLDKAFQRLQMQFSGGWFGPYRLVSDDPATHTIVVTRDQIDNASWNNWATCHVDNIDMLDSLQDGTVTIKIVLTPAQKVTEALVSADFRGVYGLTPASPTLTVSCSSTRHLEMQLLSKITDDKQPIQHPSGS